MKQILINTATNYLSKIVKIICAFFATAFLIKSLGTDLYGFWTLLWMIFGYSLVLDFGFGMSIQKQCAIYLKDRDIGSLNISISTVFISYLFIGILIALVTLIASSYFVKIINIEAASTLNIPKMKSYFIEFGMYSAIIFPTGVFKEFLAGSNRIDLRNYINLIYELLNFFLILFLFVYELPFIYLIRGSLLLCLLSNIACFLLSKQLAPFVISYRLFQMERLKELSSFSLNAYLIMCSNLIILKTDQILIGIMCPLSFVGLYQIATRIPYFLKTFSEQMQENLIPLTIRYLGTSKEKELSNIFTYSTLFTVFVSTCGFAIFWVITPDMLRLWLDIKNPEVIETTKILLLSSYIIIIGKSVNHNMLLMLNKHKMLCYLSLTEAVLNLVFSFILIKTYGIIGVALGTLIPQALILCIWTIPYSFKFFDKSLIQFLLIPLIKFGIISIVSVRLLSMLIEPAQIESLMGLIVFSCTYGLIYIVFSIITYKNLARSLYLSKKLGKLSFSIN